MKTQPMSFFTKKPAKPTSGSMLQGLHQAGASTTAQELPIPDTTTKLVQ